MKKVVIIISVLLLCACQYMNNVNESFILNYLKNSYSDNVTFSYVEDGVCELNQLGYCSAYYNASDIDEHVYVVWYDGDGNDIRDDYLFKKYKSEIIDYYNDMFSKVINNKYKVEILSQKSDYNWKKDSKFKDILNYNNLNLSIKVMIASNESNTTDLGETLKELINTRKVKNVSSLYITTYDKNCNLDDTDKCEKINSSYTEVKITKNKH